MTHRSYHMTVTQVCKPSVLTITPSTPIINLIYMISQFLKHYWHAEGISFPMIYHMYSACTSQFNNIPILVAMVTHIFPTKWFPWQPESFDLSTIHLLTQMPNMEKVGLKLAKLQL